MTLRRFVTDAIRKSMGDDNTSINIKLLMKSGFSFSIKKDGETILECTPDLMIDILETEPRVFECLLNSNQPTKHS